MAGGWFLAPQRAAVVCAFQLSSVLCPLFSVNSPLKVEDLDQETGTQDTASEVDANLPQPVSLASRTNNIKKLLPSSSAK